jgi:hypothetical protein
VGIKMRELNKGKKCRASTTYGTNTLAEDTTRRKPNENINGWLETSHELNLPISVPILVENISLLTEDAKYRIWRKAGFQSGGEWVSSKVRPGFLGVLP